MFSSAASLLGDAGQANYCAANCCLDTLSCGRVAQGLTGTTVQWGPWSGEGMANSEVVRARAKAIGIGMIQYPEGLAALQHALQLSMPTCSLLVAIWSRFIPRVHGSLALLSNFRPREPCDP